MNYRNFFAAIAIAATALVAVPHAHAQQPSFQRIYGTDRDEVITSNSGAQHFMVGTSTQTGQTAFGFTGIQDNLGNWNSNFRYNGNSGFGFFFNGVESTGVLSDFAAVGIELMDANGNDVNGFFIHFTNSGFNIAHAKNYTGASKDFPRRVKVLSDGSFVVVGSTSTNSIKQSFVTHIGAPPTYNVIFHRVIGKSNGTANLNDEAFAAEELPNGNILVAGNTNHFSRSTSPSIYLAELTPTGTIVAYNTYQVSTTGLVFGKDMDRLSNGLIGITGAIRYGSTFNGFVLNVSADYLTPTLREFFQSGNSTTRTEDFGSILAVDATNTFIVCGKVQNLHNGVLDDDAFAMNVQLVPFVGLLGTGGKSTSANEGFSDVGIHSSNGKIYLDGVGDATGTGFGGTDVLTVTTNQTLIECLDQNFISFTLAPVSVSRFTPNPQSTTPSSFTTTTYTRTGYFPTLLTLCSSSSKWEGSEFAQETTVNAWPNPAHDRIHIELPADENARLQLINLSGQVVMDISLSQRVSEIDLSTLPRGLYAARITQGELNHTVKIVVE